jgi:hypothetical protein
MIAASLWMTSGQKRANKPTNIAEKYEKDRLSYDASALIYTLRDEGAANRSEGYSEDKGKNITIGILGLTLLALYKTYAAISDQVAEMQKVYGPIKDQADAAKITAQTASDNEIANNRAWIGPVDANITPPIDGKGVTIAVIYTNSGHQPAMIARGVKFKTFTKVDWWGPVSGNFLSSTAASCMNSNIIFPTTVAYPNGIYQIAQDTAAHIISANDRIIVDKDILSGDRIISVVGCLAYLAFGVVRHSAFCYYYSATVTTDIHNLTQCEAGNGFN